MNVLLADQFSELGGAQRCLLDLAPEMADRGWNLFAAVPGRGPLVSKLRTLGARVFEIPCGPYRSGAKSAGDALRFSMDAARQARLFRNMIDRHRIEAVYANGPRIWPAVGLASRGRIPVLFHAHNPIGSRISRTVAGWSIRHARATVISCCEFVAGPLRRFAGERLAVVPNGAPDCRYSSRNFNTSRLRIGSIGRIAPEKGQLEFVRAAAQLAELPSRPSFEIHGAPMFASLEYFESVRAAAAGIPVEFAGWSENVAETLAGLDVLVISSRQDAMPRVMLEAMSAGVPVVATEVGGIGEVIEDNVTGFLARPGSVTALADRVREAISDPVALERVARQARLSWERSYTVDHYRRGVMLAVDRALGHSAAGLETAARQPYR